MLAIQRDRLLAATVTAVAEVGYARLTVARIVTCSRVSRNTFYRIFESCEDCFCATFDRLVEHARGLLHKAYAAEKTWRDGTRAGLVKVLSLMDEEPAAAKLCMVDAPAGGERVLDRRAQVLRELVGVIDGGRESISDGRVLPDLTAEGVVGAVVGVLHSHLVERREDPLATLIAPLMYLIVAPYLGAAEAAKELQTGATVTARRPPTAPSGTTSPLEGLSIRLTYRTVRVLDAVGRFPGASNREVAAQSGVRDHGQISKLLHRLGRLGLIENRGSGEVKASANSWHLTRRGADVSRMTRPASTV